MVLYARMITVFQIVRSLDNLIRFFIWILALFQSMLKTRKSKL